MPDPGSVLSHAEVEDLASGFVLGALGPEEMAAVRDHLASCPEPHPELETLGAVVPALALAAPEAQPGPELGARIMGVARGEAARPVPRSASQRAGTGAASLAAGLRSVPDGNTSAAAGRSRRGLGAWLDALRRPAYSFAAVAVVVVVALVAWNLRLQEQVSDLDGYRAAVGDVLDAAALPGGQLAVLAGPSGGGPSGLAAVTPDGHVTMAMRNLDPTSGSQVYEAWLIAGSNAPLPIGSFAVGSAGTGALTARVHGSAVGTGAVLALTLEPRPGATTPTLPILAQGRASAATS
jgi:anti-sigma-K factor RskA